MQLKFSIRSSDYERKEEYVIYDMNAFIADTGGYLGLLLGYSLIGIIERLANRLPGEL